MSPDGGRQLPSSISRRRALLVGGAATAAVLAGRGTSDSGPSAAGLAGTPTGTLPAGDESQSPVDRVHEAGIVGSGVHVGVLDTTGFDPGHAAIRDTVQALRSFDDAPGVVDRTSHGTVAAASVAAIAPGVRLSLASFARPDGFRAALDWLRGRDVDVVLAPVAAHGTVPGPESPVYRAARAAIDAGITLVAPTGNAARGHWQGPYGALNTPDYDDPKRLLVRSPAGSESVVGRFLAWLVAHDPEIDLTLALLRLTTTGDGQQLVALSRPTEGRQGERLVADLDDGDYVLEVRVPDPAAAPSDLDRTPVEVTTPTHRLAPARPAGSIAPPASVPGVLAVGAAAEDGSGAAPYSGRGPTADGRTGVDVVAVPRPWLGDGDPGTSAAASRAAGVVALVLEAAPDLVPADVVGIVRTAAGDVGPAGTDLASGLGRLDPLAAVQRARSR